MSTTESGRWRRPLALALTLVLAVGAGVIWYVVHRHYHFATVTEGEVYRSGMLSSWSLERVIERHGIRTVVSLLPVIEEDRVQLAEEERICNERGVRFVSLPMAPSTPPDAAQLARWRALFRDRSALPLLVHCKQGVVRTGAMVSVYEIERHGRDAATVWRTLPSFGHDLQKGRHAAIREFVLGYRKPAE